MTVAGVAADPLEIRLVYPEAYPVAVPKVEIISPALNDADVGHAWHRWVEGYVCYVRPVDWGVQTTAEEIIAKVADWYHNYVAVKRGLVEQMPDYGRVSV